MHDAWGLKVARFANQVADTRNWLTHWGERGKDVQDGESLSLLTSRLYLVLATNLMLDLGLAPTEVADQMAIRLQILGLP